MLKTVTSPEKLQIPPYEMQEEEESTPPEPSHQEADRQSEIHGIYTTTTTSWNAMLEACEKATDSIYLEEYILDPDIIGCKFTDIFTRKAREGVEVRLLLDWWGCRPLKKSPQFERMLQAGVDIQFFREPSSKWASGKSGMFPRDHRKVLILDKQECFIGGVCIYDKITQWRDSMVHLSGKIAKQLLYVFEHTWHKAEDNHQELDSHPDFETDAHYSIYANAPDSGEHQFSHWLMEKIHFAKDSIRLTTPYFTPDEDFIAALEEAAERGVNVEIILSDYSKYAPYVIGKHITGRLMNRGIHIYYYQPCMLHLKMMVIDKEWAAIGSCNLDGLSIHHNQEVMLVSNHHEFVETLNNHFERDLTQSNFYTLETWEQRPWDQKLSGYLLMPFKRVL